MGLGCNDILIKGQDPKLGLQQIKDPSTGNLHLGWIGNPAAFTQPCVLGSSPPKPIGCVPLTGLAALGGYGTTIPGPGFAKVDFSLFKNFTFKERYTLQFRTEIFNIANHPTFNAPSFGGNGVVAIGGSGDYTSSNFGLIGSTRLAPYDARQIQFALKFLF